MSDLKCVRVPVTLPEVSDDALELCNAGWFSRLDPSVEGWNDAQIRVSEGADLRVEIRAGDSPGGVRSDGGESVTGF